ncbi:RNA polymerase sigma factor [Fonticella tunisiensis]|uniref:RNA polymerase RpoE-like sigma-24 subunit n=1 Tax=Fonticella tunisiensis TaxID=1096341 RepID=A0A4R7KQ64_9CLOT|nr:RNA polymerase sigma factor [Fonticella tunisiensis]TDT61185.1 RNA polymerase RpoE-like sigma-24 subunit [Fonticella tunisiensis]
MDEVTLVEKCRSRDLKALEELFILYEKKIYNLCFYTLKNSEDAMDAAQEACLKIYKSIDRFKGESKLSTWIYRITYNTCMDYIKKKKNCTCFDDVPEQSLSVEKVESLIENRELRQDIKRCIMALNDDFRTIILLRDINGLSYQEISDVLGIQVGTVKSRLSRAREALKAELIKCGIIRR